MNQETYEGWRNVETWQVNLHLENDEASYLYWKEQAERQTQEAPDAEQVRDGIWTAAEAAKFNLAAQLEEEIREAAPIQGASVYSDLLSAAMSRIDWDEIAANWLVRE